MNKTHHEALLVNDFLLHKHINCESDPFVLVSVNTFEFLYGTTLESVAKCCSFNNVQRPCPRSLLYT